VGAIFDGTGFGADGTVWGGELLVGDVADYERVGMLHPVRLPGGEKAIREPWRMACAWLAAAEGVQEPPVPAALRGSVDPRAWRDVSRLADSGLNSPVTSSMGRLFDAVGALCGIRATVNYEGQAAIELEAVCSGSEQGSYPISVGDRHGAVVIDPRETVLAVASEIEQGVPVDAVASRFHTTIAGGTVAAVMQVAHRRRLELAVLSGGVFLNRRLLEAVAGGLDAAGLRVLIPERLPIGDGGISYGQAAVAAARLAQVRDPRPGHGANSGGAER
jgi:hydrogenase maturation protein HypF